MNQEQPAKMSLDPATADLIADMMRLGQREYSEVGVPMFLIAEDMNGSPPPPIDASTHWRDIATLFGVRAEALAAHRPDLDISDVARMIEVFADRYLVASMTPAFTAIADPPAHLSCETEKR